MADEKEAAPADAGAANADAAPAAQAPAPEAPAANAPVIVIKKVIDEGHGGAHGGAWKIALADMMTAMMAFFSAHVVAGCFQRRPAQEHR